MAVGGLEGKCAMRGAPSASGGGSAGVCFVGKDRAGGSGAPHWPVAEMKGGPPAGSTRALQPPISAPYLALHLLWPLTRPRSYTQPRQPVDKRVPIDSEPARCVSPPSSALAVAVEPSAAPSNPSRESVLVAARGRQHSTTEGHE